VNTAIEFNPYHHSSETEIIYSNPEPPNSSQLFTSLICLSRSNDLDDPTEVIDQANASHEDHIADHATTTAVPQATTDSLAQQQDDYQQQQLQQQQDPNLIKASVLTTNQPLNTNAPAFLSYSQEQQHQHQHQHQTTSSSSSTTTTSTPKPASSSSDGASILRPESVRGKKRNRRNEDIPESEKILPIPLHSSWRPSETYPNTIKDDWQEMKWWRLTREEADNMTHFLTYEKLFPREDDGSLFTKDKDKEVHALKYSNHECIGGTFKNRVCTFHNLVLWNGTFYYVTDYGERHVLPEVQMSYVGMEPFVTYTNVTERVKPVTPADLDRIMQEDERDPLVRFETTPKIVMEEVLLVFLSYTNNYGHLMGEAAPILHNILCMYLGRCSFGEASRRKLQILLYNRDREVTNMMPSAIREELWPCFSQMPLLRANDRRLNHTIVLVNKMVAGVGPHCRGFPWCRARFSKAPVLPAVIETWRKRAAQCARLPEVKKADPDQPDIVIINRPLAHGRSFINAEEVAQQLAADFPQANVRIEILDSATLAEQAAKYQEADILLQMHGAALGNLIFLPTGAVYIDAVPIHNSDKHAWAEFMAQDFNHVLQLKVVPLPELKVELMEDLIMATNGWRKMTPAAKDLVLKEHKCPQLGTVGIKDIYQSCVVEWFMKRSNAYLEYEQVKQAVETGLALMHAETDRRQEYTALNALDLTYYRPDRDVLDLI
jgi:hypothetical protein